MSKIYQQIKQAEARKDNPLAKKLREEKKEAEDKITVLTLNKGKLIEEYSSLNNRLTSTRKVLSEYEKNFKLVETDQKKFEVTEKLLVKINTIIQKMIKELPCKNILDIGCGNGKLLRYIKNRYGKPFI